MKFWYLIFLTTFASTTAFAASFDCKKAKTVIEKTICTDSKLNKLDEDLAGLYKEVRGIYPGIVAEQREWLSSLKSCNDAGCLKSKYEERNSELVQIIVQNQRQEMLENNSSNPQSQVGNKKNIPPVVSDKIALSGPQKNAVQSAKQYLSFKGFSRDGLIHQLSSRAGSGYDISDATVAVDSLKVDWDEQAVIAAKSYLDMMAFSCQRLTQQLSSRAGSKFTPEQAIYGAKKAGAC
jgi:uncharacterized protein